MAGCLATRTLLSSALCNRVYIEREKAGSETPPASSCLVLQ